MKVTSRDKNIRGNLPTRLPLILNAVVSLFVGAAVYICDRPDTYVAKMVYSITGFKSHIKLLPTVIDNHLPDFVWAYALVFMVYIAIGMYSRNLKLAIVISILFAVLLEVFQLFMKTAFTFDIIDIVVEIIAIAFGSAVITKYERKERL